MTDSAAAKMAGGWELGLTTSGGSDCGSWLVGGGDICRPTL